MRQCSSYYSRCWPPTGWLCWRTLSSCLSFKFENFNAHHPFRKLLCDFTMLSALISGQKRQYEECERIFGDQKFFLIEELSDDTPPPIFERIKMSDFDDLSTLFPPLPEIFPDAALNFLAANLLYDDHLLPENENDLNLESLDNAITFHAKMCNAEGCNGLCNHDGKTDVDTLYASPRKHPRRAEWTDDSCNGSCNHDNITDASYDSDYLDDEDAHDLILVTRNAPTRPPATSEMAVT